MLRMMNKLAAMGILIRALGQRDLSWRLDNDRLARLVEPSGQVMETDVLYGLLR